MRSYLRTSIRSYRSYVRTVYYKIYSCSIWGSLHSYVRMSIYVHTFVRSYVRIAHTLVSYIIRYTRVLYEDLYAHMFWGSEKLAGISSFIFFFPLSFFYFYHKTKNNAFVRTRQEHKMCKGNKFKKILHFKEILKRLHHWSYCDWSHIFF